MNDCPKWTGDQGAASNKDTVANPCTVTEMTAALAIRKPYIATCYVHNK